MFPRRIKRGFVKARIEDRRSRIENSVTFFYPQFSILNPRSSISSEPGRHLVGGGEFDDADAADLRMGADFFDRFIGRLVIEVEDGDGLAAGHLPAYGHLGDVDLVFAEDRTDEADQARHIAVRE